MVAATNRITVTTPGLADELARLRAVNVEIDRVGRMAAGKAARSAAAAIKKGMQAELSVPAKQVKNRITARIMRDYGLVWIGLEPFLPTHLGGNVAQTATGVTAGNRTFPGAFLQSIYTSEKKVWIRLRSKHYDSDLYPYKKRNPGHIDGSLRHRFPVVLGRVKVDTEAIRDMINHEAEQAGELLADLVANELGLAINRL